MVRTSPQPKRAFALDFTPLRKARRSVDLTQADLARVAGISRTTLYRTERNLTAPSVEQLVAIARELGMPMHHLFVVVDGPQ